MERRLATLLRFNEDVVLLQEENWMKKLLFICKKTIRWGFVYTNESAWSQFINSPSDKMFYYFQL
jgi:hypothetical protein